MKQMMKHVLGLTAAALVCVSCSKEPAVDLRPEQSLFGRLALDSEVSLGVESRAELDLKTVIPGLTVPTKSQFTLELKGDNIEELEDKGGSLEVVSRFNYSERWPFADYPKPDLYPGLYTATVTYGNPEAIGRNLPYYKGSATAEVKIGQVTECKITAKIANAAVRIQLEANFKKYFSDPEFYLVVNDAQQTAYKLTGATGEAPVFVPAGAKVSFTGTVRRPSQTSDNDKEGELLEVTIPVREMAAGTLHTYRLTAEAGSGSVDVVFEDAQVGSDEEIEVNDGQKS